jgi:sulfate permease, SulP family
MACIGGILAYVASAMVKPAEVKEVLANNKFHIFLMVYTAVTVIALDFLKGVLSATIIWVVFYRFFDKPAVATGQAAAATE